MSITKLRLLFPSEQTGKPVTYHLVKEFNLVYNIFQAHVRPGMRGEMIIEVTGEEKNIKDGISFLKENGITVQPLTRSIKWDEETCIHCGACTSVCPTGALSLDENAKLVFDNTKCIVCEMCVSACPSSVLEVNFTEKK